MSPDLGVVRLVVQTVDGHAVDYATPTEANDDHDLHVVVLRVRTDTHALSLVIRRGDLAQLLAHPNEPVEVEVALFTED